jgi:hypothetical protein
MNKLHIVTCFFKIYAKHKKSRIHIDMNVPKKLK